MRISGLHIILERDTRLINLEFQARNLSSCIRISSEFISSDPNSILCELQFAAEARIVGQLDYIQLKTTLWHCCVSVQKQIYLLTDQEEQMTEDLDDKESKKGADTDPEERERAVAPQTAAGDIPCVDYCLECPHQDCHNEGQMWSIGPLLVHL